ncbi:hypothetical protein MNBD_ALPHA04-315 [hydrothermal vent metagenome]|uniref:HTH luxR-type domain-containing protein n=1 Tax=hydrothermal vent metagenome TaxID=652676 RepID=A0A3B0RFW6_9ZZZZ
MGQIHKKLTPKQIECLLLVGEQMTSKEIARTIRISPFTVDQRLDAAREILGVSTRREAYRKFMLSRRSDIYEASLYEPYSVGKKPNSAILQEPVFEEKSNLSEKTGSRSFGFSTEDTKHSEPQLPRMVPLIGGQRHNLSKVQISKSILVIALLSMICLAGMVLLILGIMQILERTYS